MSLTVIFGHVTNPEDRLSRGDAKKFDEIDHTRHVSSLRCISASRVGIRYDADVRWKKKKQKARLSGVLIFR